MKSKCYGVRIPVNYTELLEERAKEAGMSSHTLIRELTLWAIGADGEKFNSLAKDIRTIRNQIAAMQHIYAATVNDFQNFSDILEKGIDAAPPEIQNAAAAQVIEIFGEHGENELVRA